MSTHYPNFGRLSGGLGSVLKSFTKSLKSTSTSSSPIQVNPKVVGGGADQQKLFSHLSSGNLQARAAAVIKISESLEKYAISLIPEIWYSARDLCELNSSNRTIRRNVVQLLVRCIEQDHTLSASVRLVYFQDIARYCNNTVAKGVDPDLDLFLKALTQLTNDGRDIYDLVVYKSEENLMSTIGSWIDVVGSVHENAVISTTSLSGTFFSITPSTTHSTSNPTADQAASNQKNLLSLIQFTKNCFKFNFNIIEEALLGSIMLKIASIGSTICLKEEESSPAYNGNGGRDSIISSASLYSPIITEILELINSLVVFGRIPSVCFHKVIELVCCCNSQNEVLTWEIISNLASDVSEYLVLTSLCEIILNEELQKHKLDPQCTSVRAAIGAINILEKIHTSSSAENKGNFEYIHSSVLKAARSTFQHNVPSVVTALLKSINRMFLGENIKYFERLFPFQVWYSSTSSMYDALKAISLNSEEDEILWKEICSNLQGLYELHHVLHTPKDRLVDLFMYYPHFIDSTTIEFVLNFYSEERYCVCHANPQWKENAFKLLNYFYYNPNTDGSIKIKTLSVINDAFDLSIDPIDLEILLHIFKKSSTLTDLQVIKYLEGIIVRQCLLRIPLSTYNDILDAFKAVNLIAPGNGNDNFNSSMLQAFCKIFVIASTNDPARAQVTYNFLIAIAKNSISSQNVNNLLTISRCLVRLRCTNEGYFYFSAPTDMDGLATAVNRNTNDSNFEKLEYLWVYPEHLNFLPEEYFNMPSRRLVLYIQLNLHHQLSDPQFILDISLWFDVVLDIMQKFVGWEIYTFVWAHFCPQLANMQLFSRNQSQVLKLRSIVCDQLTLNLPSEIQIPNKTTKANLQVMFVRTLSALMGYHTPFSKHDEDQIINALIFGLSSWEKTAIPCIHILTVCCYETPLSIKKFLSLILSKLQTRISSPLAASPTLEFLLSLINLETLTANFTLDEFRRVFAIAFKYIQHCSERQTKNPDEEEVNIQVHGIDADIDQTPSTSTQSSATLSHYVLALLYHVISAWYLKLNMNERKQLSSFLIKNLLASCAEPQDNQQVMAYIDLITRFTYSDLDLAISQPLKKHFGGAGGSSSSNGNSDSMGNSNQSSTTNTWIIGGTILTISTNGSTGDSEIIIRRPTGITNMKVSLNNAELSLEGRDSNKQLVTSNHLLLQLFNNMDVNNKSKPIPLIEDPVSNRAISTFDRVPTVEFHKVGLVYMGPNQLNERDILGNRVGSLAYQEFSDKIGTLIRLNQCKEVYVGGLDTESNTDGEYAIFWKSKTQQLVFHTTTMMPNNENDKRFELKKRHIGNNYVNIFFDELGLPFNFNVIRSQFNFLNIVITPHSLSSANFPVTSSGNSGSNSSNYYKVKIIRRAGVPGVFACCHFKIISQEQLPVFIRNLSIISNLFASVWHTPGEYVSNWAHRFNQIKVLKEKTIKNHQVLKEEQERGMERNTNGSAGRGGVGGGGVGGGEGIGTNTAQSFLEQLREVHPISNFTNTDTNKFEYIGAEDDGLYSVFEFNSYT